MDFCFYINTISTLYYYSPMNNKKLLFLLVVLFFTSKIIAQCNATETIIICDMTKIDIDNDGNPDGIINLYDEYKKQTGKTLQEGI
jgi:hypothetical protein